MSLKTWEEEFYPIKATASDRKGAVGHSLRKWIGLRPENLERHNLQKHYTYLADKSNGPGFSVSGSTCALCHFYVRADDATHRRCEDCPLKKVLGTSCDDGHDSPYGIWQHKGDPEPMILALSQCDEE